MQKGYALITGASSGIGYEMADILAAKGFPLILVARREDRMLALKDELIKKYKATVVIIPLDLSQRDAATILHTKTADFDVEILINNAGFGTQTAFLTHNMDKMAEMVQLNIITLTHLTQLYANDFIKRGGGRIMQVASGAAFLPTPYFASYAATKSYVLYFSEALYFELRHSPVSLSMLYPGFTATEFGEVATVNIPKIVSATQTTAREVAEAGIAGMLRGKKTITPGWFNSMNLFFAGILPRSIVAFATGKVMESAEK